jgi:hypothetical protein
MKRLTILDEDEIKSIQSTIESVISSHNVDDKQYALRFIAEVLGIKITGTMLDTKG